MNNNNGDFILGLRRRKIEDDIVSRYEKVNFEQNHCLWLEDKDFWDYVFSWYELAKYYDDTLDTAVGVHMLDLYMANVTLFRTAAVDRSLPERRRDKAADALYQINYYVNQMMNCVHRNSQYTDDSAGEINWKP